MRKESIKKFVSILLLVTTLLVIFMLSQMKAKESDSLSEKVLKKVISVNFIKSNIEKTDTYIKIKEKVDKSNVPENKKEDIILGRIAYKYNETFRETLHSCEYTVLSLVMLFVLRVFNFRGKKVFIITILFCFIYACSDEIHQIFVKGRAFEFLDIMLDTIGAIVGAIIYLIFYKIFGKKKSLSSE